VRINLPISVVEIRIDSSNLRTCKPACKSAVRSKRRLDSGEDGTVTLTQSLGVIPQKEILLK
jgi:hypothetical protein